MPGIPDLAGMNLLFAGIILSLIGSLPPGLISLSVAYTALERSLTAALVLAFGAAFAEFFQAWVAVLLTDWFLSNPAASAIFEVAAMVVFIILGCYLIYWAQPPQKPKAPDSGTLPVFFLKGIVISAFNLLAIPYWFTYCGWLRMEGWWGEDTTTNTLLFALGVTLGTCLALALYAWLGTLMIRKAAQFARHANRFIGLLFWALAMKTLFKLLQ